ncbi:hypothetical protein E3G52_000289 [Mycobacteroides abscessus]|uniref:hypothetical protein n=1 Tax=Mycobacteroides abscessus TaxID=36809 RepID=UPI001877FFA9|nr:hypothetical protein [Mycobacteroides abscessus]MBE5453425.1 hypothetical protein [Mycobacteroides abscessus]
MNDPAERRNALHQVAIDQARSQLTPMERLRSEANDKAKTLANMVFVGVQGMANTYAGTVPPEEVRRRRRKNRDARRARRGNKKALVRQANLNRATNKQRRGNAPTPLQDNL